MKFNLRIEFADGTSKDITCSASDLVAFEDKYNLSVAKLGDDPKLSHLLFLAYSSESRRKQTALDFTSWVDTVAGIESSDVDPKSVA